MSNPIPFRREPSERSMLAEVLDRLDAMNAMGVDLYDHVNRRRSCKEAAKITGHSERWIAQNASVRDEGRPWTTLALVHARATECAQKG